MSWHPIIKKAYCTSIIRPARFLILRIGEMEDTMMVILAGLEDFREDEGLACTRQYVMLVIYQTVALIERLHMLLETSEFWTSQKILQEGTRSMEQLFTRYVCLSEIKSDWHSTTLTWEVEFQQLPRVLEIKRPEAKPGKGQGQQHHWLPRLGFPTPCCLSSYYKPRHCKF